MLTQRAMIRGLGGEEDGAVEELQRVLQMPSARRVTVWELRLDPNWDFMRDNPRFQALATP